MTFHHWTPEMLTRFRELHAEKPLLSFSTIVRLLNKEFNLELTRNAVIGKAHRLNLPMRALDGSRKRPIVVRDKMTHIKPKVDAPILPKEARLPNLQLVAGLTLLQLRQRSCRWPVAGEREWVLYCGQLAIEGRPYCSDHCNKAYNR